MKARLALWTNNVKTSEMTRDILGNLDCVFSTDEKTVSASCLNAVSSGAVFEAFDQKHSRLESDDPSIHFVFNLRPVSPVS